MGFSRVISHEPEQYIVFVWQAVTHRSAGVDVSRSHKQLNKHLKPSLFRIVSYLGIYLLKPILEMSWKTAVDPVKRKEHDQIHRLQIYVSAEQQRACEHHWIPSEDPYTTLGTAWQPRTSHLCPAPERRRGTWCRWWNSWNRQNRVW